MKKQFNVIAIGGVGQLISDFIAVKPFRWMELRRTRESGTATVIRNYMDPVSTIIEVDEDENYVLYNGKHYEFVQYRGGVHGAAIVISFKVNDKVIEAYTDTPTSSEISKEEILEYVKQRKNERSGY